MTNNANNSNNNSNLIQNHLQFDLNSNESTEGSSYGNSSFIFSRLSPAKPTKVFDTYWKFAAERQSIFFRKLKDEKPPWTDDWILRKHKFTNAYRASDRVSQFLIKEVIYNGP
ncbi:putative DNA base hypermodification protein, partial [Candidatus Parvarchaeota archaeon]|nr:putative DNA base hypermodification protein [Candidatus Parvarchaeota archaeon]